MKPKIIKKTGSAIRFTKKLIKWLFKGKSLSANIAFFIVAYIALKYLLFPGFLMITGLNDVVAVISGSMHHQPGAINATFNNWLEFNGFNKTEYSKWPFIYGLDIGDAVTVIPGNISIGDVVVYYHNNEMIIHRVVAIKNINGTNYYTTKGDANPESINFELMVPEKMIKGKAGIRIPWLGWPRTAMYYLLGF